MFRSPIRHLSCLILDKPNGRFGIVEFRAIHDLSKLKKRKPDKIGIEFGLWILLQCQLLNILELKQISKSRDQRERLAEHLLKYFKQTIWMQLYLLGAG